MAGAKGQKKCPACGKGFRARNRVHVYCSRETCKAGRRSTYMKRYMSGWKRKHPNYWRTERQKEYMKQWRESHPAYFKSWRDKAKRRGKGR